jgi:Dolichyl-phosphate-mannose-protein mannosyltransferase
VSASDTASVATTTSGPAVLEPVAAPRDRGGMLGRARAVAANPALVVGAVLGTVVAVSALVRIVVGTAVSAPAIFGDELIYAELARSLGESGVFEVRDAAFPPWTYGPLYPILLAPLHATLGLGDAYAATKSLNAVVMSLAAVPAYFLARRLLDRRVSLFVAALTVAVPGMAYTTRVMTENLFYPLFLTAVLAIAAALERPTTRRQVLALAAVAVACLGRAQAIALLPAFLSAALVVETLELRRGRADSWARALGGAARRYAVTCGAGVAALVAAAAYTQRPSFRAAHGQLYEEASLADLPRWIVYHVAELDLAVGVIPFAAFLALLPVARTGSRALLAFTALTGAAVAWSVLLVAGLAAHEGVARIQERYLFYVTPLFLIALFVWLRPGSERRARTAVVAAAVAAILPAALPLGSVLDYRAYASTMALIPWLPARESLGPGAVTAMIVGFAAAAGLVFVLLRRVRPGYLVVFAVANLAVLSLYSHGTYVSLSNLASNAGIGSAERDWIDGAVGPAANVTVVWSGVPDDRAGWRTVWQAEFFNRSVRDVVALGAPMPHLYAPPVHLSGRALRDLAGAPVTAQFVLADSRLGLQGTVVATNPSVHQTVYRVDGPVRLVSAPSPR